MAPQGGKTVKSKPIVARSGAVRPVAKPNAMNLRRRNVAPTDRVGVLLFINEPSASDARSVRRLFDQVGLTCLFVRASATPSSDEIHSERGISAQADRILAAVRSALADLPHTGCSVGVLAFGVAVAPMLVAAARNAGLVQAVVGVNGRPDLAAEALPHVHCPTLFILTGRQAGQLRLHRLATSFLNAQNEVAILQDGPTAAISSRRLHDTAKQWFTRHLPPTKRNRAVSGRGKPRS